MRQWPVVAVLLAAVALGAVTMAVVTRSDAPVTGPPAASDPATDPQGLVGVWNAEGSQLLADKRLHLRPSGRLRAAGSGCRLMGGWSATSAGLAVLSIHAVGGRCGAQLDASRKVFAGVQRFRVDGTALQLTDFSGVPLLTLTGDTDGGGGSGHQFVPRPGPAPLPAGVLPVSASSLVAGRWLPGGTATSNRWSDRDRPHATFAAGGGWSGSDGCNRLGGRWSMESATPEWLSNSLGQTDMGCDNVDVSGILGAARSVGLDGDELVFFDTDGNETGRFVRDPTSVGDLSGA
ncbi:MAG: META domain-containing protein [Actinomycetes bacterium]